MSGVDPNGGGALVIPGGGGASLSDATPAAPGTAAAGVGTSASRDDHVHTPTTAAQVGLGAVTATGATEAAARTAIGAVGSTTRVVYDFSSSTGWTADAGTTPGASAAVTGGVARLSIPSVGSVVYRNGFSGYHGPSLTRTLDAPANPLDVALRMVSLPASGTNQLFLEISESATAGTRIAVMLAQTGIVYCYRQDINTFDSGPTISITTDTWIRIRAEYGTVQAFHGAGTAGALPTSWTSVAAATVRQVAWRYITIGLVHNGSGVTVDTDDLTIVAQELVTL